MPPPQLDALRAELQELKTAYEARIQALEARLKKTEAQTADAAVEAEPAPVRSSFNPDVSLILQGKYAIGKTVPTAVSPASCPPARKAHHAASRWTRANWCCPPALTRTSAAT